MWQVSSVLFFHVKVLIYYIYFSSVDEGTNSTRQKNGTCEVPTACPGTHKGCLRPC